LGKKEVAMSVTYLDCLGVFITSGQQSSVITFIAWILIGLLVGYIGSKILNKTDHRLFRYVLLSIVGGIVGGYLAQLLSKPGVTGLNFYSMIVAIVGAGVFLIVYHAIFRRRRFLDMR
jgi:uncharacterized membrane protein YeaQ/YmgE (transglycosylase-associated protein family)